MGCIKSSRCLEIKTEFSTSYPLNHGEEAPADRVCDRPLVNRPQAARVSASTVGRKAIISSSDTSKLSWLPPLRFQLPTTPEEDSLQLASPYRPLLNRSQICTTATSSVYSQNTFNSGLTVSRRPSIISSLSDQISHGRLRVSEAKRWLMRQSLVPAMPNIYRHHSQALLNGGEPVKPGSGRLTPPGKFWTYTPNQRMQLSHSIQSKTSKSPDIAKSTTQRGPSLYRYPHITPSAKSIYPTPTTTVHSEITSVLDGYYKYLRNSGLRDIYKRTS